MFERKSIYQRKLQLDQQFNCLLHGFFGMPQDAILYAQQHLFDLAYFTA